MKDPVGSRGPRRRFDTNEQEAYLNLWRTYDRLKALEDELFAPVGISAQQYNALRLLRAAAPTAMTVQGIGAKLISRAPDMTRLLDRLEQRGWIARHRRSDNRRVVDVVITAEGISLLNDLAPRVRDCHERQLGHLDQHQLMALTELLEQARAVHEPPESIWASEPQEDEVR